MGATPMFHQSWLDMYPLMSATSTVARTQYTSPFADVLSWLAFVLLCFVAFPFVLYTVWPNMELSKMLATNPRLSKLTHVELLLYNRSMLYQHALVMVLTSGLWMLLTSCGFVWPLEAMAGANVPPLLPSFDKPNPAALRVGFQDLLFANVFGVVAVFLDYVPIKLTGQRASIVWTAQLSLWGTWALSIWNKVMVNAGEDDMLSWPGAGAFGEWRPPSERSTAHTLMDVVWYVCTIFGTAIAPLAMVYMLRNALIDLSKSLRARRHAHARDHSDDSNETDVVTLWLTLVGRFLERTQAHGLLTILSRVFSPPEQQYLTVDRIAYAMQARARPLPLVRLPLAACMPASSAAARAERSQALRAAGAARGIDRAVHGGPLLLRARAHQPRSVQRPAVSAAHRVLLRALAPCPSSQQEPSKKLRRKHFHEVGASRDKFGWWYCSNVPPEIDEFQRNQVRAPARTTPLAALTPRPRVPD